MISIPIRTLSLFAILFLPLWTDSQVPIQWENNLGGSTDDKAKSIQNTPDGGYIMAGWSESQDGDVGGTNGSSADVWVLKIDSAGSLQWEKTYGGSNSDQAESIQKTSDGGYVVAGRSTSDDGDVGGNYGSYDYWVLKLDGSGNLQWQKHLGGTNLDRANSIVESNDGAYVVSGYSKSSDSNVTNNYQRADYWVAKLDSGDGSILWEQNFGGTEVDVPYSIKKSFDGGYIIAGRSSSDDYDVTDNNGGSDYWIVKLDSAGNLQWEENYGGSDNDRPHSIIKSSDVGYTMAGYSESSDSVVGGNNGEKDFWVVKIDTAGTLEWEKNLGGTGRDVAYSIQQTIDEGYITTGYADSSNGDVGGNNGGWDYWVTKLDKGGTLQWEKNLGGSDYEEAKSIPNQKSYGGHVIAGHSKSGDGDVGGNLGENDVWVVKLDDCHSTDSINRTVCDSFTVPSGDETYFANGIYRDTISNSIGCDSLITIDLTVKKSSDSTIFPTVCNDYTVPSGDKTFDSSGTYLDTVPNSVGCDSIITVELTVTDINLSFSSQDATCDEVADGSASASPNGGTTPYSYSWSTGDTTASIDSLEPGTYSVTVTDSNGCQTSGSTTIGTQTSISLSTNVTDAECGKNNGQASVFASGGTTPYSYLWSSGDTTSIADSLAAGTYTIQVTDANGCEAYASVNVNDASGLTATIDTIVDVTCPGGSDGGINIDVSGGTSPYSYRWSNGATSQDLMGVSAGPYEVEVMDADSCKQILSMVVEEPDSLELKTSTVNASCGSSDGKASVSVSGGTKPYNYQWSSGGTSATEIGLSWGSYTVTVTDSNGCKDSATASVSEDGGPSVMIDDVTHTNCSDSAGSISINVSGGTSPYSYQWSNGDTTQNLSGVAPGTYSLSVEDASGCKSVIDTTVDEIQPPQVPICVVSVDSTRGKNLVVWEKPAGASIKAYNIYKESFQAGVYSKIGTVQDTALSTFVDTNSDPQNQAYRYKISSVDSCGNESPLSSLHKTIHLTVNKGLNNDINLVWDDYKGFSYQTFFIHRYTDSTGWKKIDSISSTNNSYTDGNAPATDSIQYVVTVEPPFGSCTATRAKDYNNTISNAGTISEGGGGGDDGDNTALNEKNRAKSEISAYPNPSRGRFTIEWKGLNARSVSVYDAHGRRTRTLQTSSGQINERKGSITIDLKDQEAGVYWIRIEGKNQTAKRPVVVE